MLMRPRSRSVWWTSKAVRQWRGGDILPSEASERIHYFHKEAQEIFKTYNYMEPMLALGRAVARGFVTKSAEVLNRQPSLAPLRNRYLASPRASRTIR